MEKTDHDQLVTLRTSAFAVFLVALGLVASLVQANPNPYKKDDGTWISMNGTVNSVKEDSFTLNYGWGFIVVEMDDGDRDADGYQLMRGDRASVTGRIDDDFFETTTIEAASVFVENLGTTFFSSAVDDEDKDRLAVTATFPILPAYMVIEGAVTAVSENSLSVDTGARTIRVNVSDLADNPLDEIGYQRIRVGHRVSVRGLINSDLFSTRELKAEAIVSLGVEKPELRP